MRQDDFVVDIIVKRIETPPIEYYTRLGWNSEAIEERLDKIEAIDDGRNPFAWGDYTIVVTLIPFDGLYDSDSTKGLFRAVERLKGASYEDENDFINNSSVFDSMLHKCMDRIDKKFQKNTPLEIVKHIFDFDGGADEMRELQQRYPKMQKITDIYFNDPETWGRLSFQFL